MARVHVRSWQVTYQGLLPQDYLDGLTPEDWASRYTFGRNEPEMAATVVAVDEGVVCGFASTCPSRDHDLPDFAELWMLYVDPHRCGEGIGRLLIAAARDRMRQTGAHEALLWVADKNERARRFYQSDGWRAEDLTVQRTFGGVLVGMVRYRCALI